MNRFIRTGLFSFFAGVILVIQCSSPTDSDNSTKVVFRNIWFSDEVDTDQDGYLSQAHLNFDLDANKDNVEVVLKLWFRLTDPGNTTDYLLYFETAPFSVEGNNNPNDALYITIGSPNAEFEAGMYEFRMQVFPANNPDGSPVLDVWREDFAALAELAMEPLVNDQLPLEFIVENNVFTDIYVEVSGQDSRTIEPQESTIYNYSSNPGTIDLYGETSGTTSEGNQIGLRMYWDAQYDVSNQIRTTKNLVVNNDYFFIYVRNEGTHDLHNFYVNYGASAETFDNIFLPADDQTYRIGYYEAYNNTEVRAWWYNENTYVYWIQGQQFTLPWEDNQYVVLLNNSKMIPSNEGSRLAKPSAPAELPLKSEIVKVSIADIPQENRTPARALKP